MNKISSILIIGAILITSAACSKKDEPVINTGEMAETMTETVNDAKTATVDAAKETMQSAESMGENAMDKAGAVMEDTQNKAKDMAATAEEKADDVMTDAAAEAARLKAEAQKKMGIGN